MKFDFCVRRLARVKKTICGFAAFAAAELVVSGRVPGGAILLFSVPGVLFLVSYGTAKFRAIAMKNESDPNATHLMRL